MALVILLLMLVLAYLVGAIPFGVLLARMKGINLLEAGSRNTGATNAYRCAGPLVGILTAVLDTLKGLFMVWLADRAFEPDLFVYLVGIAAILGHTKSVFLRFRGGKAVATSFGVFLYINTVPILLAAVVWLVTLFLTRMVSFASIMAGLALPVITILYTSDLSLFFVSLAVGIYAIWRHRENIDRILKGTEHRIQFQRRVK